VDYEVLGVGLAGGFTGLPDPSPPLGGVGSSYGHAMLISGVPRNNSNNGMRSFVFIIVIGLSEHDLGQRFDFNIFIETIS
jgi:hypothetical protein